MSDASTLSPFHVFRHSYTEAGTAIQRHGIALIPVVDSTVKYVYGYSFTKPGINTGGPELRYVTLEEAFPTQEEQGAFRDSLEGLCFANGQRVLIDRASLPDFVKFAQIVNPIFDQGAILREAKRPNGGKVLSLFCPEDFDTWADNLITQLWGRMHKSPRGPYKWIPLERIPVESVGERILYF